VIDVKLGQSSMHRESRSVRLGLAQAPAAQRLARESESREPPLLPCVIKTMLKTTSPLRFSPGRGYREGAPLISVITRANALPNPPVKHFLPSFPRDLTSTKSVHFVVIIILQALWTILANTE